jgi:hypothetical protein
MNTNTAVDLLEVVAFVLSAATGIALKMHMAGSFKGLHVITSFALVALVGAHILLHKAWFSNLTRR